MKPLLYFTFIFISSFTIKAQNNASYDYFLKHQQTIYFRVGNPTYVPKANTKDNYTIKLKNDSTLNVFGEIDMSDSIHALVIKDKRKIIRKIYPNDTKYIIALGDDNLNFPALPHDSCWVFQQTNDSISLYSVVPVENKYYSVFYSNQNSKQLFPLTTDNLLKLVGNDEKLIKIIKKEKNLVKAVEKYNDKVQLK
ncbi:MAG: hypothetical protein JWN78_2402 [Bacteroidota bacterium]|nr:hypothetical protein [Bacteroidota bacterium]